MEADEQARILAWYYNSLKNSKIYQFWKMKMCFLYQIVNKDSNTPQAKKIFHK